MTADSATIATATIPPRAGRSAADRASSGGTNTDGQPVTVDAVAEGAEKSVAAPHGGGTGGWGTIARTLGMSGTTLGANDCLTLEQLHEFRRQALLKPVADPVAADELSAALALAERIRSKNMYIEDAADRIGFIINCLMMEKPQLTLAGDARSRLQVDVFAKSNLLSAVLAKISAGSPTALVLFALLASLFLWALGIATVRAFLSVPSDIASEFFFMNGPALAAIVSAAFIGGVVSIATRLHEFSRVRDLDPFAMFWTAMLKPLIGVFLALFILCTLAGGVISFGFLDPKDFDLTKADGQQFGKKTIYVLWVLGFLAGFSERFAWDFVDRAQGVASGGVGGDKKPA